ncbi:5545_t:CDS:2 [Funneliformis mosseae]|uniref:5545_t:CDS:1 n=1 Tax=Funneliformis mosseae TaxID=27381 RepID=A0A9N8ZU43_FUNMO|nr:5545_t:CDS:2 [Funneliformis mosseae]
MDEISIILAILELQIKLSIFSSELLQNTLLELNYYLSLLIDEEFDPLL